MLLARLKDTFPIPPSTPARNDDDARAAGNFDEAKMAGEGIRVLAVAVYPLFGARTLK